MVFCNCVTTTTTQDINVTDNKPFKRFMVIGHEAFFVILPSTTTPKMQHAHQNDADHRPQYMGEPDESRLPSQHCPP